MHTSQYPHGSNSFYSRYVAPVLKFYKRSDHTEFYSIDGDNKRVLIPDTVRQVRRERRPVLRRLARHDRAHALALGHERDELGLDAVGTQSDAAAG